MRRPTSDMILAAPQIALLLLALGGSLACVPRASNTGTDEVAQRAASLRPHANVVASLGADACGAQCCPKNFTHVLGTSNRDRLTAAVPATCVVGLDGGDNLASGAHDAYLAGGDGSDTLAGGAKRDTIVGGDGGDTMSGGAGRDHIDGGFGVDNINAGDDDDLVLGGPGNDSITLGTGQDYLDAGSGDDSVFCGSGDDHARGGPGNDTLRGEAGADQLSGAGGADSLRGGIDADYLDGGGGNDELLGEDGDDILRPGPGKDIARGGPGNDTVYVEGPCEITGGEILDGGTGTDVLVTSMTVSALVAAGVTVTGFETVKSVAPRPGICDAHDSTLGLVEFTGTSVEKVALWRDRVTKLWFEQDGASHDAEIWTRTKIAVDGAYDSGAVAGSDVFVYSLGGEIDFADGTGVRHAACCVRGTELGYRYRMRVRQKRDGSGAIVAYEQEAYVSGVFGMGLLLWLAGPGPIPHSLERPSHESPQALCPAVPTQFPDPEAAIAWAKAPERWEQDELLCPGGEPSECPVARVAFFADPNTEFPDEPPLECNAPYPTFFDAIVEGTDEWYRSGSVSTTTTAGNDRRKFGREAKV